MRRLRGDRGAVAVMVALMMIPILVCAALVVDVGSAYVRLAQLQNAADAGALAIAQDCAGGSCGAMSSTANALAIANVPLGATATAAKNGFTVAVTVSSTVNYTFAPVIGIDTATVSARAGSRWGWPSSARTMLPIIFSWCSFKLQTGGGLPSATVEYTISDPKSDANQCSAPSGLDVPGGFGWLNPDSGRCTATSNVGAEVLSSPGRSVPSSCSTQDFEKARGKTVLLAVYDKFGYDGSGSNALYRVYAYAAFHVTGYNFVGQYNWNPPHCGGSNSCIRGYFTKMILEPSEVLSYGTDPTRNLGAGVVGLCVPGVGGNCS